MVDTNTNNPSSSSVINNSIVNFDYSSTTALTTTTNYRIFAFSHRRPPHFPVSISISSSDSDSDNSVYPSEDELIVDKGLGVIKVNGEAIDLNFLASHGRKVFESELNRMTKKMKTEDELLGFLKGLKGRWGSNRRRRKYVDASFFVKKVLPINWKILLSLRPRVSRRSLYCRKFVRYICCLFDSSFFFIAAIVVLGFCKF